MKKKFNIFIIYKMRKSVLLKGCGFGKGFLKPHFLEHSRNHLEHQFHTIGSLRHKKHNEVSLFHKSHKNKSHQHHQHTSHEGKKHLKPLVFKF